MDTLRQEEDSRKALQRKITRMARCDKPADIRDILDAIYPAFLERMSRQKLDDAVIERLSTPKEKEIDVDELRKTVSVQIVRLLIRQANAEIARALFDEADQIEDESRRQLCRTLWALDMPVLEQMLCEQSICFDPDTLREMPSEKIVDLLIDQAYRIACNNQAQRVYKHPLNLPVPVIEQMIAASEVEPREWLPGVSIYLSLLYQTTTTEQRARLPFDEDKFRRMDELATLLADRGIECA